MRYEIVPALPEHVLLLRQVLRDKDRFEITCTGISVRKALWRSYRRSLIARTAFVDGEIACMGGVGGSPLSGVGEPWLMTGTAIEKVPVALVKEARREIARWLDIFPRLSGYVSCRYESACRFLVVLGFTLSEPFPVGPAAVPFARCTLERRHG